MTESAASVLAPVFFAHGSPSRSARAASSPSCTRSCCAVGCLESATSSPSRRRSRASSPSSSARRIERFIRRETLRPVIFVKYYDKASTILAADQVSEALRQRGFESQAVYGEDVDRFCGGIVVFIKTSRLLDILRARKNRNRTVLDVHDTVIFKRRLKNLRLFDGLILRNRRAFDDFRRPAQADTAILLHWDPRFRPHTAGDRELKAAYLGDQRSCSLWNQIPGVVFIDSDYFELARNYNCHVSIRRPGKELLYKPAVKVSTAGACGAVLITTRDEAAVELLGPGYPYYTGHEPEEILETLRLADETMGSETWRGALNRLGAVREGTSLERLINDYVTYFEGLS